MNLNINRVKIILSTLAAFFLCCSMHGNCNDPGPATEVHGVVTDGITGKPIANLTMVISSSNNFDPHYFSTDVNGKYDLKFTPQRPLYYDLRIASPAANNYLSFEPIQIKQGTDSLINLKVYTTINVTVHLVNHTNYGYKAFQFTARDTIGINSFAYSGLIFLNNQSILIDTTVKYPMARYTHVAMDSFFSTAYSQGYKDVTQNFVLGNKDTLINITNQ